MEVRLYRCCVKDNVLVEDVFEYMAELYMKKGGGSESEAVPSISQFGKQKDDTDTDKDDKKPDGGPFVLKPSTIRTGGKKTFRCLVL